MIDIVSLIKTAGYVGIFGLVFAESGLLIGIFFPGDSLLFTAGILASQGYGHIAILALVGAVAAITGDSTGYWLGRKFGPRVFTRTDSFFLDRAHIERAQRFYDRYGAKTIILARFVPIVRTLAPVLAGVGSMDYGTFITYNIIGGLVWGAGLPLAGYCLGNAIPNIDHYLLPIIALIVVVSVLPAVYHFWLERKK